MNIVLAQKIDYDITKIKEISRERLKKNPINKACKARKVGGVK